LAPRCWRPQLPLHSDPLPGAPHQNQSCLFAQTPPAALLCHTERFVSSLGSQCWYPLVQRPFLFAMEGYAGSSLRSSLAGLEVEHPFSAAVQGEMPSCGARVSRSNRRKLAIPLGAAGDLWGRPCLVMSLWNI